MHCKDITFLRKTEKNHEKIAFLSGDELTTPQLTSNIAVVCGKSCNFAVTINGAPLRPHVGGTTVANG